MASRIGVSIYQNLVKDIKELEPYIKKCSENNVKILFTNLIHMEKSDVEGWNRIKEITRLSKKYGISVYGDIDDKSIEAFGIDKTNINDILRFFKEEIMLSGIRFDLELDGSLEAKCSKNDFDFKIILNASSPFKYLEYVMSKGADISNIIGGYNYYPQMYTGPSLEFFQQNLAKYKKHNIDFQAFVALQRDDVKGPWAYNDNLPSLEMHRSAPLDFQIRHMVAMGVKDIFVSTQYVNDEEFNIINNIDLTNVSMKIDLNKKVSKNELEIIFDKEIHFLRPDLAEYINRSSLTRIKYKNTDIKPTGTDKDIFKPGDVVVLNNNGLNYKGELHIILKELKNNGNIRNLVGTINENEYKIMELLQPGQTFKFIK
ncbi:MupG family TIM beta-alpha barrel fold protein [Spiroplasma endosymbiont of Anurida maritima]|uniref:MupG family TIM beta-alpha barrel fold protein n=1 Tax=Spiroplasma endosymbiont of Anurida maritima TaxID=2967972 RepID=UPI0036D3B03D